MIDKDKLVPIIIDFGLSYKKEDINMKNIKDIFYVYGPDYVLWCPEIHFISYISKSKKGVMKPISNEEIEKIAEEIYKPISDVLDSTTDNTLKTTFKTELINQLTKYNKILNSNISDEDKLMKLTKDVFSWDNYSLSIAYIKILKYLTSSIDDNNEFVKDLYMLLFKNIHPNPEERLDINKTYQTLEYILMSNTSQSQEYTKYTKNKFESVVETINSNFNPSNPEKREKSISKIDEDDKATMTTYMSIKK